MTIWTSRSHERLYRSPLLDPDIQHHKCSLFQRLVKLHLRANYLIAEVFIQQEVDYPGSGSENSALKAGTGYLAAGRGNSPAGGGRTDWLRPHGNRWRSRKRLTLQLVQLVVTQINRRLKGQTRGRRKRSPRRTLHKKINIAIKILVI